MIRKQHTELAPSKAISEKVPAIAGTLWINGYSVVSRHVEVLIKFPPDALLNCHLLHDIFLGGIREHIVFCDYCPIAPGSAIQSGLLAWEWGICDCMGSIQYIQVGFKTYTDGPRE